MLASVCRRFFKYLFWYFCSSAIDPLSACILLGEIVSPLLFCIVATDDSESLDALDESESDSGACCGCCVNFIRETLIFGDGVNEDDPADEGSLFVVDKFIRLSFCTFFLTKYVDTRCGNGTRPFSSSSSSSMCGKVNMWLWVIREAETFDGDDDGGCWELEILTVVELEVDVQEEEVEEGVAVGKEFKALVSAVKVASWFTLAVRIFSPNKGVVKVGDDEAEVVTEAVVMPISVVVTIVSMSGDESAVSVVYVGVWVVAVVGVIDPPPVDKFFSILLWFSAGAELPPRHGKQQRNSVERRIVPQVHDFLLASVSLAVEWRCYCDWFMRASPGPDNGAKCCEWWNNKRWKKRKSNFWRALSIVDSKF